MKRISPKAVVLGSLLVLALDAVVSVGLVALRGGEIFVEGRSVEQISEALHAVMLSKSFLLASMVLGTLTTVIGGYVAARIGKQFPYFNGLVIGLLGMLIGLTFWSEYPLWFNLLALVSVVPSALLGSHIAVRRGVAHA